MRYLLLLFLAGCASSAPRQYAQGIPVAPSAPAFDPVFESPTNTGHPGYVGPAENLPRSPHARVLPETPATRREPGLWAGDQPRAAVEPPDWREREPKIWELDLPEPDDVPATSLPLFRDQNRLCAAVADRFDHRFMKGAASKASIAERRCLAARLYWICAMTDIWVRDELRRRAELISPHVNNIVERNKEMSVALIRKECTADDATTDWVNHWFSLAAQNWKDLDWRLGQ